MTHRHACYELLHLVFNSKYMNWKFIIKVGLHRPILSCNIVHVQKDRCCHFCISAKLLSTLLLISYSPKTLIPQMHVLDYRHGFSKFNIIIFGWLVKSLALTRKPSSNVTLRLIAMLNVTISKLMKLLYDSLFIIKWILN